MVGALLVCCASGPTRSEVDPRPPPVEVMPEALSHCDARERMEAALCRVDTRIAIARDRRDIVWLSCLNDKRQALETIRRSRSGQEGQRLSDVMTERQLLRLEQEAEQCR